MKKYKYTSINLFTQNESQSIESLNKMGNDGWELISVVERKKPDDKTSKYFCHVAYLKREKL